MKTKTKIKNIYIDNEMSPINPSYVLQLARAGYKYCRVVDWTSGRSYIFTNKKVSSRQAKFLAFKRPDREYLADDFALQA